MPETAETAKGIPKAHRGFLYSETACRNYPAADLRRFPTRTSDLGDLGLTDRKPPVTSGNGIVHVQQAVPLQYESTRLWIVVRSATFVHIDVGYVGYLPVCLRNRMLRPHRAIDVQ